MKWKGPRETYFLQRAISVKGLALQSVGLPTDLSKSTQPKCGCDAAAGDGGQAIAELLYVISSSATTNNKRPELRESYDPFVTGISPGQSRPLSGYLSFVIARQNN